MVYSLCCQDLIEVLIDQQRLTPHFPKQRHEHLCYKKMNVLELMRPFVVSVGPKTQLREILQLMHRYNLNDILVVDGEQKLVGIVTHSDLSRKLLPTQNELMEHEEFMANPHLMEDRFRDFTGVAVDAVMTRNVITVSPDLEALKAGAIMIAHRVKQVPVVRNDKVIGIISPKDIGWGLMTQFPECMKG
jgi:CBS domain-containing protein